MRSNRFSPEQQEAVSRRLALLSAELTGGRDGPADVDADGRAWVAPDSHTRIASHRWAAEIPPATDDPPAVPVPGRHARARGGLGRPGPHLGHWRAALGPGQLAVLAVVVALGLVLAGWWLLRSSPTQIADPGPAGLSSEPMVTGLASAGGASSATPGVGAAPAEVVVDVAGKVRRPGIAVLKPGSRVVDALKAAGGVRAGVDLTGINLARPLVDGEQILVGLAPEAGVAAGAVATAPAGAAPLVGLNSAGQAELESLPEVGPVTAQAIITWREEHGGFTAVDELLEVDGIGEATLGQIAPLVTL